MAANAAAAAAWRQQAAADAGPACASPVPAGDCASASCSFFGWPWAGGREGASPAPVLRCGSRDGVGSELGGLRVLEARVLDLAATKAAAVAAAADAACALGRLRLKLSANENVY